ncbi:hypothetical protein BH23ACT11_BH23ACT11_22700 [soil metagenome]
MGLHWRLALVYAASVLSLSVLAGSLVLYFYGGSYAIALTYGVAVGLISFVSTALTVSLLTGSSTATGMIVGGASFAARLGFATVALGVPAYLEIWPAVTMMVAFASVYVAENVLLVPVLLGKRGLSNRAEPPVDHRIERRAKI